MANIGSQGIELELAAGAGGGAVVAGDGLEQQAPDTIGIPTGTWYRPEDYGAVGDGGTNDGPAFNTMIAAMPARGGTILLSAKVYFIGTSIVLNKSIKMQGVGGFGNVYGTPGTSQLRVTNNAIKAIDIQADNCELTGFELINMSFAATVATAIGINATTSVSTGGWSSVHGFNIHNMRVAGFYTAINAMNAWDWGIDGVHIHQAIYGVKVSHPDFPDAGDSYITNCEIKPNDSGAIAGIYQENSGGLRIDNNKINGWGVAKFQYGYFGDINGSTSTGLLLINNTSIENYSVNAIRLQKQASVQFDQIVITGNQMSAYAGSTSPDIVINEINIITITGNTFRRDVGGGSAIQFIGDCFYVTLENTYRGYTYGSEVIISTVQNYADIRPGLMNLQKYESDRDADIFLYAGSAGIQVAAIGQDHAAVDLRNKGFIGPGTATTGGVILCGGPGASGTAGGLSIRGAGYNNASENMYFDKDGASFNGITASMATAIVSPRNGLLIYVTDAGGVFTSPGFWGRESGVWVKLKEAGTGSADDTVQTLTDAATIAFDVALGKSAMVTIAGNRTLSITNFLNGQFLSLLIIQDATGGRGITLPAGTKVIGNGAGVVDLTDDPSAHDILSFWKMNNTIYCNYGKKYN